MSNKMMEQVNIQIQKWLDDISNKTGIERCFIQEFYNKHNRHNRHNGHNKDEKDEKDEKDKHDGHKKDKDEKDKDRKDEKDKHNGHEKDKEIVEKKKSICPYQFVSGARKGQQCGSGIRDPLQMYCSRHKNKNGNDKNIKNENKEQKTINKKEGKQEMVKHITRLHPKIKKYIHESTGMVFISKEEKIVFGHWDGETIHPLTEDDKQVCFIYHFRVDDTRYEEQIKIINSV
jgi:hypothetical protein